MDDGTGPDEDLPDATKAGVIEAPKDASGKTVAGEDPEEKETPYSRTGWVPQLGWPADNEGDSLLDHTTWVEEKLPDHLYGGEFQYCPANVQRGLTYYRLVSQRCSDYIRLLKFLACSCAGWGSCMGHDRHDDLFDLLPNLTATSAP